MSYNFPAFIVSILFFVRVMAFPRETAVVNQSPSSASVTEAVAPDVTDAARLRCTDGSTVLHTTDCTMGTPISFCHKPQAPIKCDRGYFPSVWHPDHCMEQSTCFPLDATWITTECKNGALPYTTKTMFDGVLAGGHSTVISGKARWGKESEALWQMLTIAFR